MSKSDADLFHDGTNLCSSDEAATSSIPSNVYEYFQSIENGHFPFFNNTQVHISAMRNVAGETLLITAARLGHSEIVERLVSDIDVEETDNDGWTALLNAAHHGHARIVRTLLTAGTMVDNPDLMGWTPLIWACYKNRLEAVEVLLEFKAHINIIGEEDGLTPLIIASGRGYTEIVRRLLSAGAQVNTSDKFGSTALIWAARKAHLQIVEDLLNSGAELDAVGMHSSTALMLATRGNHIRVVETLLSRDPNINVVDYNGLSALGIAAREGYTDIAGMLLLSGAYVNTVDRFGNSILASAVRSGNTHLVRMLLEKHADVNAKDSEGRTPLHLAIDKSYADIVLALLEKKPNLELKNWDGDTALIRAVKNRDVQIAQLLVNMGAKLSATDNAGDNALHLALRSRSRRLTQILLINPSDSKLLYRPNKLGETPYSIDQESPQPILPSIFGPIGTDVGLKSLLGFDSYSDVLADVVCEPNLSLPLTIGLYAKWGSGKSLLLPRIRDSMSSFSRTWLDGIELYWSWMLVLVAFLVSTFLSLLIAGLCSLINRDLQVTLALGMGAGVFVLSLTLYGIIYYGSEVHLWNSSIATARLIGRTIARFKLMLSVLVLNAPIRSDKENREKKIISPVSFLFADDHRLSFIGGEHALTNIVQSLFAAAEEHYGTLAVRLFSAFKSPRPTDRNSRLQSICGIPILLLILTLPGALSIASILCIQDQKLAASVFLAFALVSATFLIYLISIRLFINLPKRRIAKIANRLHLIPFERMLQKLQKEVDLLVSMVYTLDEFTNNQTRLVIMVDGLDSCESNKMVQMLDALSLFFCSRQSAPFIVLLAIDPNIVISTIHQNLRAPGPEGGITGRDYLKNIVTMPFFLDHVSTNRKLHAQQNTKKLTLSGSNNTGASLKDRIRSDTFRSSKLSLRGTDRDTPGMGVGISSANDLGYLFPSFELFANTNPRTMRRIVNSIALTGRLLRVFEIEFSWWQIYAWCSMIEQWTWRMCWIIDVALSLQDDALPLHELYGQLKSRITVREGMEDLDRNSHEFETAFRKLCGSKNEQLTVGHVKLFAPCTSNLDPYLRRIIREQRGGEPLIDLLETQEEQEEAIKDPLGPLKETVGPEAEFLFDDAMVWSTVNKPLAKMSICDVWALVQHLSVSMEQLEHIKNVFNVHNLNGLALHSCDMDALRRVLDVPLGDWTLIRLLVESLRKWKPYATQSLVTSSYAGIVVNPEAIANRTFYQQQSEIRSSDRQMDSIREEEVFGASPMLDEKKITPERRDEDEDGDDTNSAASVAGSENRSLLKSSTSPPKD